MIPQGPRLRNNLGFSTPPVSESPRQANQQPSFPEPLSPIRRLPNLRKKTLATPTAINEREAHFH